MDIAEKHIVAVLSGYTNVWKGQTVKTEEERRAVRLVCILGNIIAPDLIYCNFSDLRDYRRASAFVEAVCALLENWPKTLPPLSAPPYAKGTASYNINGALNIIRKQCCHDKKTVQFSVIHSQTISACMTALRAEMWDAFHSVDRGNDIKNKEARQFRWIKFLEDCGETKVLEVELEDYDV